MNWGLISSVALVLAGAAVVAHGLISVVTGRATLRRTADALLIGMGASAAGLAPYAAGVPTVAVRTAGLVLVLGGTLLGLRDRARRNRASG